jgi:hypothetical protein
MNDLSPSPYSRGMLTSNIPRMEYAMSSTLVVFRFAAQDILLAVLEILGSTPSSASASIPVMCLEVTLLDQLCFCPDLLPLL